MTVTLVPLTIKKGETCGTFSKAVKGSMSLNFGVSGGRHCDTMCPHHPQSHNIMATHACYAVRSESYRKKTLAPKLRQHENREPDHLVRMAEREVMNRVRRGKKIPWFRFSTNGSVPQPDMITQRFRKSIRSLLRHLKAAGVPVHLPVETAKKAASYRRLVMGLCVVRESCNLSRFLLAKGAVSTVVGRPGQSREQRLALARDVAKMKAKISKKRCIVCPAIASRYLRPDAPPNPKAKCGRCICCSLPEYSIIYPLH